jgi:hypothetical protein
MGYLPCRTLPEKGRHNSVLAVRMHAASRFSQVKRVPEQRCASRLLEVFPGLPQEHTTR